MTPMTQTTAAALRAWRAGHKLTQTQAAPLFGVALRKYQRMEAKGAVLGEHVELVMIGYNARQAGRDAASLAVWIERAQRTLKDFPPLTGP